MGRGRLRRPRGRGRCNKQQNKCDASIPTGRRGHHHQIQIKHQETHNAETTAHHLHHRAQRRRDTAPDLLTRIATLDPNLPGLTPDNYNLLKSEKLNEAINRSWNRLLNAWGTFKSSREKLPEKDAGTTLTRERWLLPLFAELGYGRLLTARAIEVNDKSYAISHGWQHTPIHLVSFRVDLDQYSRSAAGAARNSPHSLVQELLNRSEEHLWGIVSNGLRLRVLRNNASLTRQAYVEFDLEAMMNGEVYADFALLWLLCHQSRVEAERPAECWLEKWSRTALEQGTRALDQLRNGVEKAITALGGGFLAHPANSYAPGEAALGSSGPAGLLPPGTAPRLPADRALRGGGPRDPLPSRRRRD